MPVKNGDTVSIHYIGTYADGTEFDRSRPGSPLRFKSGAGQVIPGFDKAVIGKFKRCLSKREIVRVFLFKDKIVYLRFGYRKINLIEHIQYYQFC